MTEAQVAAALSGEVERPMSGEFNPDIAYVIRRYVVGSDTLSVRLRFGPRGLSTVTLVLDNTFAFSELEAALTKKYRAPANKTQQSGQLLDITSRVWSFPTTSIQLERVLAAPAKSWVMIIYQPTANDDADKL
jgi:hypothetical protein